MGTKFIPVPIKNSGIGSEKRVRCIMFLFQKGKRFLMKIIMKKSGRYLSSITKFTFSLLMAFFGSTEK
ncbi:hypothetical protein D3C72_925620 [compost metagenome]